MKINFKEGFKTLDGKAIKGTDGDYTLSEVCTTALLADYQDEHPNGQEKSRRYSLAVKIYGAGENALNLSSEDIVLLKELIAKAFSPLIVGQAYQILEGEDE